MTDWLNNVCYFLSCFMVWTWAPSLISVWVEWDGCLQSSLPLIWGNGRGAVCSLPPLNWGCSFIRPWLHGVTRNIRRGVGENKIMMKRDRQLTKVVTQLYESILKLKYWTNWSWSTAVGAVECCHTAYSTDCYYRQHIELINQVLPCLVLLSTSPLSSLHSIEQYSFS